MFFRFAIAVGIIAATFITHSSPASAEASTCAALKGLDTDQDGTIDLAEAQKAAGIVFDKIERDKDNTVDAKEAKGRLSKKELLAGDPDNDGTLTKDEYLAIIAKRFSAADPDGDGKLDCKELGTADGAALLRLLK